MKSFDDQLRAALQRREPPPGFTALVMARIPAPARRTRGSWLPAWLEKQRVLRWAAVTVACGAIAVCGVRYRRYREARREGEQARAQAMLALRIASAKLNAALAPLRRVEAGTAAGTEPRHQ